MNIVIAHAADISRPGGGTDRVSAFASGLSGAGHDVTLVIPRPTSALPERIDGVRTSTVAVNRSGVLTQPMRGGAITCRAKRVAEKRNAILQIEHSPLAGLGATMGCREYVLDMHDLAFPSPLYGDLPAGWLVQRFVKVIEGRGLRKAKKIAVVSDRMKQFVRSTWTVPDERFVTVPNGYFERVVKPFTNVSTVTGRVVFLGTLHPKLSVEAMAAVGRLPEVTELIVVGDGPKRAAIERIESDKLRLTGYLPDMEAFKLVASADVAINPQRVSWLQRASSPVKLYYYAALGVAMVLTEGPDVVDSLGNHGAAAVVAEDEDFAEVVRRVLRDDALRASMQEKSREMASEFGWDTRVDSVLELYDE